MFERYNEERTRQRKIVWPAIGAVAFVLVAVLVWTRRSREDEAVETMNALAEASLEQHQAPLAHHRANDLPGMAIETPEALNVDGDYDHGAARGVVWTVSWSPNVELASAEDVPNQAAYVARRTGTTAGPVEAFKLNGAPAYQVAFSNGQKLVVTTCGDRSVEISGQADEMTRAVASFQCKPAPGRLLWRSATVERRAGWRLAGDRGAVHLVNDRDVNMILVAARPGSTGMAAYDRAFELAATSEHRGDHTIRRGKAYKADNSPHPGALVTWPCAGATGYAYIMQWGDVGLDDGIALALTGRCLRLDEPAPAY
jgi:hypothetical protein